MEKEVLLKVENLQQLFGKFRAVNGVSFEIYKGEVFGLEVNLDVVKLLLDVQSLD